MTGLSTSISKQLGLTKASGRQLIRSIDELGGLSVAPLLRRTWEQIGLNAILFVDGKPTVYFKEVVQCRDSDMRRFQRFVWNQGIATLLIISTQTEVLAFSGLAAPASETSEATGGNRLVERLNRVSDALEVERLVYRIESGRIYEDHAESFDREQTVDQYLLRNLNATAVALHGVDHRLSLSRIHSLLGRTIFVCYLIDRQIIDGIFFASVGVEGVNNLRELFDTVDASEAVEALYKLFSKLQDVFNGSLFEEELDEEKVRIDHRHIRTLSRFLKGDEVGSGQTTLGFWAYDFNFIPVETISAIYEEFLGIEQQIAVSDAKSSKRTSGSYYTPKHLAELMLDTAIRPDANVLEMRVLDPACGSGIFLVAMFNRMAERWRFENPARQSSTRWQALVQILQNNLFGVDSNETACRITCFSLYLALLDQFDPRDICELAANGRLLPPLLLREQDEPTNEPRPIICRNFFDDELLRQILPEFDLIVGNPPWVGRNQPNDPVAESWYAENVKQKLPSRQIAHAFMWKCPQHISKDGRVCLVLPSKVFLNRTNEFQEKWFEHNHIEEVLQLADLSFILFEDAACPAMIVRYGIADASIERYPIEYISPQANRSDPRRGVVVITPQDRQRLWSDEVIAFAKQKEVPSLWKMYLRGTPRDIRLLNRLRSYPRLENMVGSARKPKRFVSGQGFQPDESGKTLDPESTNRPMYPWWKPSHLFVDAKKEIDFVLRKDECDPIGSPYEQYYRVRDPAVFQKPLVLISQGFSKVAYCDFNVLFQDSLQSITGEDKDGSLLMFLCAFLRSKLATYFLFHTSANWGTERDKVQKYELLQLPFFPPEHEFSPKDAQKIIDDVGRTFRSAAAQLENSDQLLNRDEIIRNADLAIEPLIFRYFDCDEFEQALVKDTCAIVEPSATPGTMDADIPTLRSAKAVDRINYAEVLTKVLNGWARRSPWSVSAKIIASPVTGFGVVVLTQAKSSKVTSDIEADSELIQTFTELQSSLKRNDGFRTYMRGLTIFEGETIYLMKPLVLRSWTTTAALNDADHLAAAILSSERAGRK